MKNTYCALLLLSAFLFSCKKEDSTPARYVGANVTEGTILASPNVSSSYGKLLLLDQYGNTLKEKLTEAAAFNFQKWENGGDVRYTYLVHDVTTPSLIANAITPCFGVVLDSNFNELRRVRLLPYGDRTAQNISAIDMHEFVYLGDNHFIVIAYYEKAVSNIPASLAPAAGCKVITPIIQEIQNDEVVFDWTGSDYPEFYSTSVEGNNFAQAGAKNDYMHLNSVFVDPSDNNLICSFRNLNQVLKINRTTKEIMWRLGGSNSDFTMGAEMKFLRQHNATISSDGNLLLYDNGQVDERPFSRVAEFTLNEAARTVRAYRNTPVPGGVFSEYMGSVQKRGNTYFICCGSVAKIIEVNYLTNEVNFNMDLEQSTYRAFKY